MKLAAVNSDCTYRLYLKDLGDYHVTVWGREQDTVFRFCVDSINNLKYVNFQDLSSLNQAGINWAQYTISSGKKNGTWLL